MTKTKKAYIAAIIDDEGSILLQKIHKNEFSNPCISIVSTTLELLNHIKIAYEKVKIIKNLRFRKS